MIRRLALAASFLLASASFVCAQEAVSAATTTTATAEAATTAAPATATGTADSAATASSAPATAAKAPVVLTDDQKILDLDITTASLVELAAWCKSLGLSEGGTKDELVGRLRSYFKLPAGTAATKASGKTVVIESALGSEYFTLEAVNEDYARLKGNVVVSFKDDTTTHRIKADEILFNRTRNIMTARGNVEYVKTSGDSTETFRGDSITVDVDTWSGLFLGGASEKGKKTDTTAYRFKADTIERTDEKATLLTDATIENAGSDEAYWSLTASKIWLLPGSDWAVSNALLRVGEIPLLYIPFFFLPGEKLFFHPVFGYRSRDGAFIQTTTYLLGQPKVNTETESSIMKMIDSEDDLEVKREGLYLVKTTTKKSSTEQPNLSMLFDVYSNLGSYLGLEATIPKKDAFGAMTLSAGLGLSRNVYLLSGSTYSPYVNGSTSSDWNSSYLFNMEVPLRYRFKSTGSIAGTKATLTWSLPLYSDPYVDDDFLDRSEDMDWFNLVKSGASTTDDDTSDVISSYEWRLTSTLKPDVSFLNPWLTSFSVSSLTTYMSFSYKADTGTTWNPSDASSVSPSRYFFYPSSWTLISFAASLAGKPVSIGSTASSGDAKKKDADTVMKPRSPWGDDARSSGTADAKTPAAAPTAPTTPSLDLAPPTLSQAFTVTSSSSGPKLDLSYTLTPSFSSVVNYLTTSSDGATSASEVNWNEYSSIANTAKLTSSVITKLSDSLDVSSATLTLTGTGAWTDHPYLNTDSVSFDTASERNAQRLKDYKATYFTTSENLLLSTKPFYQSSVWSASTFQYTLASIIAKSVASGSTWALRDRTIEWGRWTDDYITTHTFALNLAASIYDMSQTLSMTANLPPEDSSLTNAASFKVWKTTTTANMEITDLDDGKDMSFEPLTVTETVKLTDKSSLFQSFIYDFDDEELSSAITTATFGNFSSTFTSLKSVGYSFDDGSWVSDGDKEFRPYSLAMAYSLTKTVPAFWKRRINLSFTTSSSLSYDLLRYTKSAYTFSLSTTLKINDFMDITLAAKSQNSVIFRYIQDWPIFDLGTEMPGETNPLIDLYDSFKLWDDASRRASGFKLKSLSLSTVHYLGDWKATLTYTATPYLDTTVSPRAYKLNNAITFLMQWVPISEFKVNVTDDKDGFEFVDDEDS